MSIDAGIVSSDDLLQSLHDYVRPENPLSLAYCRDSLIRLYSTCSSALVRRPILTVSSKSSQDQPCERIHEHGAFKTSFYRSYSRIVAWTIRAATNGTFLLLISEF